MPEADAGKKESSFSRTFRWPRPVSFSKARVVRLGMKNRLARVFRPDSGRTVMLAIDHGYFQGPTTGLERVT